MRLTHYEDRWMTIEERDYLRAKKNASQARADFSFNILSDIRPFSTQDGVEISSRSSLRAYEQKNGVKQVGNDLRPPRIEGDTE